MKHASVILAALLLAAGQLQGYSHWKLKDGTGSKTVKDSGTNGLTGTIVDPEHCAWGQEDDRGFFLSFSNGKPVQIPNSRSLILEQGMEIDIHFSCDLSKIGPSRFACLLSKGEKGSEGYSVMVGKNGDLMLNLRRITPSRKILKLGLRSLVDYKLRVTAGEGKVKVFLDGKQVAEYPYKGTLGIWGNPLYLGGLERYPFSGNIYDVKIKAYGEKIDESLDAIRTFVPRYVDPEGTVTFADYSQYSPQSVIRAGSHAGLRTWNVRRNVYFFKPYADMIYPPADVTAPDIWVQPEVAGKYDVYVSLRAQSLPVRIQARIGEQPDCYTVTAAAVGDKHRTVEVPIARDVEVKGKKIYLCSAGTAYAGYIKLIPSDKRRDPKLEDPAGSVTRGPRMTQKEASAFLDEWVKQKFTTGFFKERIYVETRKQAEPSEASKKRGWQLFDRNYLELLFKVSVPTVDNGGVSLKLAAAPGEYEPATFGVRGLRDVEKLTLRQATPFTYADGSKAKVETDIGEVESMVKRTTHYTYATEVMYAPQYVEKKDHIRLKKDESGQFWITLRPADDAKAGVCRAVFELSDGTHTDKIPVELTIRPFKLDPLKHMDIQIGIYNSEQTWEEIDEVVGDLARHGCTMFGCYTESTLAYKGSTAEDFAIDWEKSSLPLYMKAYLKHGMNGRIMFLTRGMFDTVNDRFPERFEEVYTRLLKDVIATREKNGWPVFVYMSFDEVLSNPVLVKKLIRDIKIQKSLGLTTYNDHIWYKTSRPNQADCDLIAPLVDIFENRFTTKNFWYVDTWDEMMARCKREGKELIPYNSDCAITFASPAAARYSFGWFARTAGAGITGHYIYAYKYFFNDPYNDLDGTCTDWYFYFPEMGDRKGGPTLNWESYREGVDDLKYITTLENRIEEAEKRGIDATKEKKLLMDLAGSFDRKKYYAETLYITANWTRKWEENGKRYASGVFNVPTGWDFDWYDQAREAIAKAIIDLDGKLGNK